MVTGLVLRAVSGVLVAGASLEHVMAICRKVGRPLTMAFTLPPTLTSAAASSNGDVAENGVEEPERQQPMPEQAVKGPRAQDTDAPVTAVGVNEVGGFRQQRVERANYGCVSI